MKICPSCNQPCEDSQQFCSGCGYSFSDSTLASAQPVSFAPRAATKKEFLRLPENKKVRSEIISAAIISYVCAGITLLAGIALGTFPLVLLDVAILVGMGLGIHLAQSRVCAILLLVYAAGSMILALINTGRMSGYLIVIAGIFAVIYTFKAEKLWQQYRQG